MAIEEGKLFSRQYLDPGAATLDSVRFRTRLYGYFQRYVQDRLHHVVESFIRSDLGVKVPNHGTGAIFSRFFDQAEMRDVLDTITIVSNVLGSAGYTREAAAWIAEVENAFRTENLSYRVDSKGGVHRTVDAEFDRNKTSAIGCLDDPRYGAVRAALQASFEKLEKSSPDGKGAARDMFEAAETLTKIMCDTGEALDTGFVEKRLKPLVQKLYGDDPRDNSTAARLLSSFSDWVNAAHPYRHGHNAEIPLSLPVDMAIMLMSEGAAFIRWLAAIDQTLRMV